MTEPKSLGQIACETYCEKMENPWPGEGAYDRSRWDAAASAVLDAAADRLSDEALQRAAMAYTWHDTGDGRASLRQAIKAALTYKPPDPARVAADAARTFTADIAREDHQKFILAVMGLVPQDPDLARRIGEMMAK